MAIADWLIAASGIPLGLMKGYEFGQEAQRKEEQALADIEAKRIANELAALKSTEYASEPAKATRLAKLNAEGSQAKLTGLSADIDAESLAQNRQDIQEATRINVGNALEAAKLAQLEAARRLAEQPKRAGLSMDKLDEEKANLEQAQKLRATNLRANIAGAEAVLRQLGQGEANAATEQDVKGAIVTASNEDATLDATGQLRVAIDRAKSNEAKTILRAQYEKSFANDINRQQTVEGLQALFRGDPRYAGITLAKGADGSITSTRTVTDADGNQSQETRTYPSIDHLKLEMGAAIAPQKGAARAPAAAKPVPGQQAANLAAAVQGTPPAPPAQKQPLVPAASPPPAAGATAPLVPQGSPPVGTGSPSVAGKIRAARPEIDALAKQINVDPVALRALIEERERQQRIAAIPR